MVSVLQCLQEFLFDLEQDYNGLFRFTAQVVVDLVQVAHIDLVHDSIQVFISFFDVLVEVVRSVVHVELVDVLGRLQTRLSNPFGRLSASLIVFLENMEIWVMWVAFIKFLFVLWSEVQEVIAEFTG